MNHNKYIISFFIVFILSIIITFSPVMASLYDTDSSDSKINTIFELVSDNSAFIEIEDKATLEKKLIEFNSQERSVTIQLTLKNTASEEVKELPSEVTLVIDDSSSMTRPANGTTRKDLVFQSAKTLVNKLFDKNPSINISIVSFSSLNAAEGETEGTINDAKLQIGLSNDRTAVLSAIDNIVSDGPRTNIDAGLQVAKTTFSSEQNRKYIILLTDGVPNNAVGGIYGRFSGETATRTINTINSLKSSNINLITMMTGIDNKLETSTNKTYQELAQEVFGTPENPTYGSFHYISDDQIEDVITNNIYNELFVTVDNSVKNIVVTDTFPQEIVDNFNFEYVASPNIGNVSAEIDKTNNTITWNVEVLNPGEVATLSYKLILKDDYSKEIVDKVLPTNEDLKIDYTIDGEDGSQNTPDSPEVIVKEEIPEEPSDNNTINNVIINNTITPPSNNIVDNTVAPTPLPQTGINNTLMYIGLFSLVSFSFIAYAKSEAKRS